MNTNDFLSLNKKNIIDKSTGEYMFIRDSFSMDLSAMTKDFNLSVYQKKLRNGNRTAAYYYDFMIDHKRYHSICENCNTLADAIDYEENMKEKIRASSKKLPQSAKKAWEVLSEDVISHIELNNALELALSNGTRGEKRDRIIHGVWSDFMAFISAEYPKIRYVSEVTREQAQKYIAHLIEHGKYNSTIVCPRNEQKLTYTAQKSMSPATIKMYKITLHMIFANLGAETGVINNPFERIQVPKAHAVNRLNFTEDELKLIFNSADDFVRPLFIIGLYTGLREGDICTLKWSNVNFEAKCIRRTMNKTGNQVMIPMLDVLCEYLQQLSRQAAPDAVYVLPEHAEMYLNPKMKSGVPYRVKQFLKKIGIQTTVVGENRSRAVSIRDLHSLRHTLCYLCAKRGIPLTIVQSIVGHMSKSMTELYSMHYTLDDKRVYMQRVEGDFDKAIQGSRSMPEDVKKIDHPMETTLPSISASVMPL